MSGSLGRLPFQLAIDFGGGGAAHVNRLRAETRVFGFAAMDDAIDRAVLQQLQDEASARQKAAVLAEARGEVPYRARICGLGTAALVFLRSPAVGRLLQAVLDQRFVLTEDASCFTYYGGGDFLSMHRDRPDACAATLIVYLDVAAAAPSSSPSGLALRVYSDGDHKPNGLVPRAVIPSRVGAMVLGHGARTWHERLRLAEGERVVALTACFSTAQ